MAAAASSFSSLTNMNNELLCEWSTGRSVINSFFVIPPFYLICKNYDCAKQARVVNQVPSLFKTAGESH